VARRLDRFSRKYSLLIINVDKTKVMASDGIACRILIQNELLEQVDTFPYLGYGNICKSNVIRVTEDGECRTEFRTRLNIGQTIGSSLQKIWIPISTKIRLMKALAWPVGYESWGLRKNEEARLDTFDMERFLRRCFLCFSV